MRVCVRARTRTRARVRLCEYMCMCSVHVCVRAHTYMRACACARTFAHLVTHSRLLVVDGCSIRFFVIPSARAAPSTHTFTDPHSHVAAVVELRRGGGAQAFDTLTQQQMPPLAMPSLHPVVGRDARREGRGGGAGCRRLDAHALRRGASCSIARGDTRITPKVVIPVQVWGKGSVSELLVHLQLYVRALIWGAWLAALCLRLCLRWSFALMVDQGKLNFCTGRLLPKIMMNRKDRPPPLIGTRLSACMLTNAQPVNTPPMCPRPYRLCRHVACTRVPQRIRGLAFSRTSRFALARIPAVRRGDGMERADE